MYFKFQDYLKNLKYVWKISYFMVSNGHKILVDKFSKKLSTIETIVLAKTR